MHCLKSRLRELCDSEGIRLGKSNEKVERILAGLLGVWDYNTLLGIAITTGSSNEKAQQRS